MLIFKTLLVGVMFSICNITAAQNEKAPKKIYQYTVNLSHLKTENQAKKAQTDVMNVEGLHNAQLVFLEYQLTFTTSNHELQEHHVLQDLKATLARNGIQIEHLERKTIAP